LSRNRLSFVSAILSCLPSLTALDVSRPPSASVLQLGCTVKVLQEMESDIAQFSLLYLFVSLLTSVFPTFPSFLPDFFSSGISSYQKRSSKMLSSILSIMVEDGHSPHSRLSD
jgi:hypothetical protein